MTSERHHIQRQVVELSLGDGMSAPAMQESFARIFHDELVPELAAAFDRAAPARQLLRLDRLEIDLGTITDQDWRPELRRRLGAGIAQQLARFTPESQADPSARIDSRDGEPLRQFIYFLRHGRLPWWNGRPPADWNVFLPPTLPESQALRATLQADPVARTRFIDALDDEVMDRAVICWAATPHAARLLACLRVTGALRRSAAWRHYFWRRVLDFALQPGALPARGAELVDKLLHAHRYWNDSAAQPQAPRAARSREAKIGPERAGEAGKLPEPWRAWISAARPAAPRESDVAVPSPDAAKHGAALPSDPRARARARPVSVVRDGESIYLPGAGAILLHPFLETLFQERGLMLGRDFQDESARERGVHLIGQLSFGRGAAEYDLVTAKLLCGFALEQVIAPSDIDDGDARACDELLGAVLRHWTALRSSSRDWLRAQFFLRDGKLETVDEGFRLTVERRAQDVLLSKLPWGLGVIGFPWMREKVFVRWLD